MKDGSLDRTDISLLQVLIRDARATEGQMSEVINITPRGVYLRLETLLQEGVVRALTTKPTLASLGARSVFVYGRSRLRSMQQAMGQLSGNESVAWVAQSTGGRFYVALHLRKGEETEAAVKRVEQEAMMTRPTFAIRELFDLSGEYRYSLTDWRIICSMRDDPRMSMEEVAAEVDEPVKRVAGRFNRMLDNNVLDLSIEFDPNVISNPMCLFHIECLRMDGIETVVEELMKRHSPSLMFFNTYSNIPHMMTALALLQDFEEMRSVMRSLEDTERFDHIEVNPIIASATLNTWRDKMIMMKGRPKAIPS